MAPTKILKDLIYKVGSPIFMTSANKSGEPVCKNIDEIKNLCADLDGILEGVPSFDKASTIIDCTKGNIRVQRQGPISNKQIIDVLEKK